MKQLKFDHKLAELILSGKKTATFRVADDKDIKTGDEIRIVDKVEQNNPASWQVIGIASVEEAYEKPMSQIGDTDYVGHEKYASPQDMLAAFRQYYGEQLSDEVPVKIIRFSFSAYEVPESYYSAVDQPGTLVDKPGKGSNSKVELYADGGSRGNPGPSALGFVIYGPEKKVLKEGSKYLGITTNNQAEYHALKAGLEWCKEHRVKEVDVYMDSLLVINQMKGLFKVRNRDLWPLYDSIKEVCRSFNEVKFSHVPRELNKAADSEVNKALDALSS